MNNNMKKLASLYFEGNLSPSGERRLYRFITAEKEHEELFRRWEQEWKTEHVPSSEEIALLNRLRDKMRKSDYVQRIRSLRIRLTAAAAAIVVLLSTFTALYMSRQTTENQLFTVESPLGTSSRISLPDGTQVWLNAGSALSYDSGFNRSSRDVTLRGEAYFEVTRNTSLPFRVMAQACTFTVLGTKFNISAYDGEPDVLAALMEGSLRFESSAGSDTMSPGDLITYNCATRQASRERADVDQFRAWIDGAIRYDAITLPALLRRLAREYDVEIELCTTAFDNKTFRVSLTNAEHIETVLKALGEILPISVERQGSHYCVGRRTDNK